MNTADYIIKKLEELGINEFFGVPGDYNFNLLDRIEKNPNTRWIGCTSELNAGYAADGYARLRGYGALVTTYGVGELSAINAVAGSFAENVPVCHIVGLPSSKNIENKALLHHNFQEPDYKTFLKTFENVTAASTFLARDNAKLEIDRVLRVMVKEKKPVYIAIPSDIALMDISERYTALDWDSDKDTLKEAAELIADKINNSQRPVIIGDVLIKRFEAKIDFQEFVSKSGIPVTNFLMGTNIINSDYENYLGGYFGDFENKNAKEYIEKSDCIIAVGTIESDLNTFGCKLSKKLNDNIAIYGTYTFIDGKKYDNIKMSNLLESVTELIDARNIKIKKSNLGYEPATANSEQLTSSYIYPRIQEFLKENDIVIAETGCIPGGIGQIKFPNNVDVHLQVLWGSTGWATPAALGAGLAKSNARIILITGEGAHQLSAMETGNMLRQNIRPVVIVINNDGYTTERYLCGNKDAEYNDIVKMNYSKFARTFEGDIWATRILTPDDFDKALKVTQIMNKMCYIEACTDKTDIPDLTRKMTDSARRTNADEPIPETMHKEIDLKEISLSSDSKFEYETVVHQGLKKEGK